MKSVMRIEVRAPAQRIFDLAADVERWPRILPHYRFVRRIAAPHGERRFAMGARRGPIPVRWEAIQRPLPRQGTIEFVHTGGVTRGMQVAWRLVERGDGTTEVSIEHDLRLRWPLLGEWAGDHLIGPHFIEAIAGRTLRTIKALAEAER